MIDKNEESTLAGIEKRIWTKYSTIKDQDRNEVTGITEIKWIQETLLVLAFVEDEWILNEWGHEERKTSLKSIIILVSIVTTKKPMKNVN